jgi:AsmA protein
MKILKPMLIALAVLLLVVAAAGVYLVTTFDAARIKKEAADTVFAKTGRTLVIDGDIGLTFWPSLGVKANRVSLSEKDSKDLFAGFDKALLAVKVMPLLSKQIVADRVEIDGLKLNLVRHRDGSLNIDDLTGGQKKADPGKDAASGAGASTTPQFDIAGIRIADAEIEWRDERANSKLLLSHLDFSCGRAVSDKDGMQVSVVTLGSKGKLNADNFELVLDVPALSKRGDSLLVEKVNLKSGLVGKDRKASAMLTLSGVESTPQALKIAGLVLDIDASSGDKSIKGSLKTPVALDIAAGTVTLPRLSGEFAIEAPGLPSHPLKLPISGNINSDFHKPVVKGSLTTKFDESNIGARFNVIGGSPLTIGIEVDIDKLNVDRYLPPAPAEKKSEASNESEKSEAPIDLSALKGLNASGTLRAGSLQVKNIKARNVRVSFKMVNGKLDVAPHAADLYGGSLQGSMSLDANGNLVALKESLTAIEIAPLLKDVADKDVIEGKGDIALDVTTHGGTTTAMKKALAGSARVTLRDGAIKGINLAQTLRNAKAKLSGGNVSQPANAADKTDFSEFGASFKIANGVAHNDDLSAKSPFLRLGGNGDIDVGNSNVNYLLKAAVVASAGGQGGQEADALKGLTVPVRVSGPFEKPGFTVEFGSMVSDVAKAKIDEKKQEVQQKIEDKLKGQLKGLFGK